MTTVITVIMVINGNSTAVTNNGNYGKRYIIPLPCYRNPKNFEVPKIK
jgi:hypothetical protein